MRKRGIQGDGICKVCGEEEESVAHMIFHCSEAERIWKLSPVNWVGLQHCSANLRDWWTEMGKARSTEVLKERQESSAYLIWSIWKARNNWCFNGICMAEIEVVQKTWREWIEFKKEQTKQNKETIRRISNVRQKQWQFPEEGVVKLNVSSCMEGAGVNTGLGIIARDSAREVQQAWSVARGWRNNPVDRC